MELRDVGLQGDLTEECEEVEVSSTKSWKHVPQDDVGQYGEPGDVRMDGVVSVFLFHHELSIPDNEEEKEDADDESFDGDGEKLVSSIDVLLVEVVHPSFIIRVVVGTEHSHKAGIMVKACPELPFV